MTDAGTSSARADVVVIGAGVIGCAVALELARRGDQVVVVDKGPAAGAGSTSSSSAVVRFNYSTLENVKLSWESAQLWHRWADHLGVIDEAGMAQMITSGMLVLDSPVTRLDSVRRHFDAVGIRYEELSPDELRHRFPGARPGPLLPAETDHRRRVLGRRRRRARWVRLSRRRLRRRSRAGGAQPDGRRTAARRHLPVPGRTSCPSTSATVACRVSRSPVVSAAPLRSSSTSPGRTRRTSMGWPSCRRAGVQTRPLRQEVDVVPCPVDFRLEAGGMMVADTDLGTYFRPHPGGTLVLGGTEPECDELEWVADADVFDELPTAGDLGTPDDPRRSTAAEPRRPLTTDGARRALRRVGRLGADLRPDRPSRVLRRHRHQWKSVQERSHGRDPHGRAHPSLRGRARPRRRPAHRSPDR